MLLRDSRIERVALILVFIANTVGFTAMNYSLYAQAAAVVTASATTKLR